MEEVESELINLLDLQSTNFIKQVDFVQSCFSKRYCMEEVPTQEQIIEDLLKKQEDP